MISSLRTLLAGVLAVSFLGLAGCQDEDDPVPSATGSASATPTEPTTPTSGSTDSTPSPSVPVATGPELRGETSSVHAPEGWEPDEQMATYEHSAVTSDGSLIILIDRDSFADNPSLDDMYNAMVQSLPGKSNPVRQPDPVLGEEQVPAVLITYTEPGREGQSFAVLLASRNGQLITLKFILTDKDLQQDPDIIASVIASFEWI